MKEEIVKVAWKARHAIVENASTIFTWLSIFSNVTAVGLTGWATVKAVRTYDAMKADGTFDKKRAAMHILPYYAPAGGALILGAASAIAANHVNLSRNAALLAACVASEGKLKEYKEKVKDKFGANKADQVKAEIAADKVQATPVREIIYTGKGDYLCLESYTGRYFYGSKQSIEEAANEINARILRGEQQISMYEFLCALGGDFNDITSKCSENVGFSVDCLLRPHLTSHLTEDGTPCMVLDYEEGPEPLYHAYNAPW